MRIALLLVVTLPMFGQGLPMGAVFNTSHAPAGYAYQTSVVIPAASTSDQTNFTVAIQGSNAKFATVANGGAIQNTVTRVSQTVPADLIVTSDSGCTSLLTWGWDLYNASTGAVKMWVMIPTLTHTSSYTAYICLGNVSVSTYQGGAQGAEFAGTTCIYHVPDGTTLTADDFSGSAFCSTSGTLVNTPTATTGKIDGGANFSSASSQAITFGSPSFTGKTELSASIWIKTSSSSEQMMWDVWGSSGSQEVFFIETTAAGKTGVGINTNSTSNQFNGSITVNDGSWHYIVETYKASDTTIRLYVDGVADGTITVTGSQLQQSNTLKMGAWNSAGLFFNGQLDEGRITLTQHSADWIATEYANQSSPPVIAAF